MFTGIVEARGRVVGLERATGAARLRIAPGPGWRASPSAGDSISVNGCCLTVAEVGGDGSLVFDVVPETLARTTLGGLAAGSEVNLEASVTPTSLLGGHLVQGHVDGVGVVEAVSAEWRVTIRPPRGLLEYVSPKGSVAIDGVSLTVAAVDPSGGVFEVALIPVTRERTTLGSLRQGRRCNLECDVVVKTVVHWLRHFGPGTGAGGA